MAHYRTRYEITAVELANPENCYLIGYSPRRSKIGLLNAMRKFGDQIVEKTGLTDDDEMVWSGGLRSSVVVVGWKFAFTGRTQKEAQSGNEIKWIAG
jgi:hypothetical protein